MATIAGLSLGVFLVLFKKIKISSDTRRRVTLFIWLAWSSCVLAVTAFFVNEYLGKQSTDTGNVTASAIPKFFHIELACNAPPPGEGSSLAALFDYAQKNAGEIIEASITTTHCECPNTKSVNYPIQDLQAMCEIESHAWAAKFDLSCVQSFNLVQSPHAGHASFCFPPSVKNAISGKFIVNYEFVFGADHVVLVAPEH